MAAESSAYCNSRLRLDARDTHGNAVILFGDAHLNIRFLACVVAGGPRSIRLIRIEYDPILEIHVALCQLLVCSDSLVQLRLKVRARIARCRLEFVWVRTPG
jgi:hypothetical protein